MSNDKPLFVIDFVLAWSAVTEQSSKPLTTKEDAI
jgi:hypothetical protein